MRAKFGTLFIVLGAALLVAALSLFLYNEREQLEAGDASAEVMPQLVEVIFQRQEEAKQETQVTVEETEAAVVYPEDRRMATAKIYGYDYVGFIGIPALELELPVMATWNWNYRKLDIAPCRYYGDMYTDDLVVMAHNYPSHFGRLSELKVGDRVTFTDIDAVSMVYEVVAMEVLPGTATEEMVSGEYDLTLFTCTYGGENRVTVRCDRVAE